jgi:hypothetical protein
MADKKKKEDDNDDLGIGSRTEQLCDNETVKESFADLYSLVEQGYEDKNEQNIVIDRCWDVYNCVLNTNQSYYGTSQVYVPIVKDAIEARVTRFSNSLFPKDNRYVNAISTDDLIPYETISLLDHYLGRSGMRSIIGPALLRSGDVTGHYNLMVDWNEIKRFVTRRKIRSGVIFTDEEGGEELEAEAHELGEGEDTFVDVEDEEINDGAPAITVLDTRDVLVLPATVDRIEDASIVAVALRLTEKKIRSYIERGVFEKKAGEALIERLTDDTDKSTQPNTQKKAAWAAGVQTDSKGNRIALVYMVWKVLKISDSEERMCVTYFAGDNDILGCTRNPFWNDKINVISMPALKINGSFWGKSRIEGGVEQMQYAANDAVNMGFDSAQFALLPIVMTDPAANPRSGSMVLATAAIWEVDPKSTQFAQMPPVWKDAFSLVNACKDQIQQSLSTNPAMMPGAAGGKKPTQAQIAQDQQVALESTADPVNILEDGVFRQVIEWFYDLDYQFRDRNVLVKKFGPLGYEALLQEIPPFQTGAHYQFSWFGSEGFKAAQEIQQMIAATNVLRGIPPEQLNGRRLDLGPLADHLAKTAFGPRLGANVVKDMRHLLSLPVPEENAMLGEGFLVPISPEDDDIEHIKEHTQAMRAFGDPDGYFRMHINMHLRQLQQKNAMQQGAMMPPGAPGMPGGGAAPGMPGQPPAGPMIPKPGAQPAPMRNVQNPPGAIHPDNMVDPARMPT